MQRIRLRWLSAAILIAMIASSCSLSVPEDVLTIGGGNNDGGTDVTDTLIDPTTTSMPPPPPGPGPEDGGGDDDGGDNPGSGPTEELPRTVDPAVHQALASYGPWTARELPPFTDDRTLVDDTFETADRVVVTCTVQTPRTFSPGPFTEFAAFPFNSDVLPGLIVEGGLIEDADLRVLPLRRAPLPLVVNLASESPTITVDDPTPTSLREGVAQLMRAADERVSGISVVPANIKFVQKEVSSYEEAVLNMGVSLRYDSPSLQTAFSSEFEQRRGVEKHSVVVRLLQPMFTISADRSRIVNLGDYFDPSTSAAELDELAGQGRLGVDNPPVLIDAVTYGRVVYVTVTSSTVTSSERLKAAVSAAYGGFGGDATVENEDWRIVRDSEIQIEAYGGNDDVALAALESGQIQDFMEAVDTSTAAPLSMVLRTLDGTRLEVTDQATISDIGCTRQDKPNVIEMQLDLSSSWADLYVNGSFIQTYKGSTTVDLSGHLRDNSNNRVELVYRPPTCIGGAMTVGFAINGAVAQGDQWRIAGHAGEWACRETGTWNIDKSGNGSISLASGPPALRPTT